jgi:hypothetical protein
MKKLIKKENQKKVKKIEVLALIAIQLVDHHHQIQICQEKKNLIEKIKIKKKIIKEDKKVDH